MRQRVALVNTIFFGRTHNEQSLNKELPHLYVMKVVLFNFNKGEK
jgi:hypothetical protein